MKNQYLLLILFIVALSCSHKKAKVTELSKSYETYPYYDPDPTPKPQSAHYPYFRFDGFSKESKPLDWKVIVMENSYIKVEILPEIGGKIWGAIEKSSGNEFIYSNAVVKFRDVAMRGAWTSGGIEHNFGIIGHSPTVSTPIDYYIRENKDGSVSCFVGTVDLISRTWWEIEINLHPDNAYFSTNTKWNNFTPFVQPYYQWSNAGYQANGNLEFIYPGNNYIGHGGVSHSWPKDDEGRLLSFYENNNFGGNKSYHIVGGNNDFYAAYWHDLNFGSGNYSKYGDKLGKKIWLWSQSRSGGIWEDLLTDSDGQYVELQSGRLFNQPTESSTNTPFKHIGFAPHTQDKFKEYWFPIMDIGGVVKANYLGALNVEKGEIGYKIRFSPLQPIKDDIEIFFGEKLYCSFTVDLKPLEVWETDIPSNIENKGLRIIIGTNNELYYDDNKKKLHTLRPMKSPDDFDWGSVYGLFLGGVNYVHQNKHEKAYESFVKCLEKDSLYAPAHNYIAELHLLKANFNNSLFHSKKSLSIDTYDPKANFCFALASKFIGNVADAQDGFSVASISPEYRVSAYIELAKLFIYKNDFHLALQYTERILNIDQYNQEALLLMSIILRKSDKDNDAKKYVKQLEELSPLNHFARFEKLLLSGNRLNSEKFISMVKTELSHETFSEMALWYKYLGCYDEAIQLLQSSPKKDALINFRLSFLFIIKEDIKKTEFYFERAIQDSINFVFPFRFEDVQLLEWAIDKTDSWKPKYYLGLLQWSLGNILKAKDWFVKCNDIPQHPYFYLAKTDIFLSDKSYNPIRDFERLMEQGVDEWRVYLKLIDLYLENNFIPKAFKLAKEAFNIFPENDVVKYNYAKCLLMTDLYSECLDVLENTVISPNEGASYGRTTYRYAALFESLELLNNGEFSLALEFIEKAKLWPENLGVGRPYDADERIENFLQAECLSKLGEKDKALNLYREIITYTLENKGSFSSADFLYLKVLDNLGMQDQKDDFIGMWQQKSPESPTLKWVKAILVNNKDSADSLEQYINTNEGGAPWEADFSDTEFVLVKRIIENIDFTNSR